MDRATLYRAQMMYETDFLSGQRFLHEGLGLFIRDILGINTLVGGLAASPGGLLTVSMAPGRIYSLQNLEPTVWGQLLGVGGLPADTNSDHNIVKQGLLRDTTVLTGFAAPTTSGQSINYLIEASFSEVDATATQRQFIQSTAPTVPILQPVAGSRLDKLVLTVKAGAPATTGMQATPSTDANCVPVWVVTVAYGQTTIISANIVQAPGAPMVSAIAALSNTIIFPPLTPPQITASQNNYNPTGLSTSTTLRLNTSASYTLTGLTAPTADGIVKVIQNVGSFDLVLSNNDSGSTAANRFQLGASRTLHAGRSIALIYDLTAAGWRDLMPTYKASASDINAGTDDERFLTSYGQAQAGVAQSLTDASTVAWNVANGPRAKLTTTSGVGSTRQIGQPTGLQEGQFLSLQMFQAASGGPYIYTFASCWDFAAIGTPVSFSTVAGKRDMVWGEVVDATTPVIRATYSKSA